MDRFTRGFVAGFLAAIGEAIVGYVMYYLNLTDLLWREFAAIMTFGRKTTSLGEKIFAELGVWVFSGFVGIFLAYLIAHSTSKNYRFKGITFGVFVWFGAFAITLLFKVPELDVINLKSTLANVVSAVVWGFLAVEILHRLDDTYVEND